MIGVLHRFLRLDADLRRVVLAAAWTVVLVRLGLWLLPFRVVNAAASRPRRLSPLMAFTSNERLSWAVRAVAARIPKATCLTQALALQVLMAKAGKQTQLQIGVARGKDFEAHAWLVDQGKVLIGDNGYLGEYTRLQASNSKSGRPSEA